MHESIQKQFWNERIGDNPDFSSIGCAGFGRQYNKWLYRIREHRFQQILSSMPLDFGRSQVLDIGAGTGFYLEMWRDAGVQDIEGLDFTESATDFLKRKFPAMKIHCQDITDPDLDLPVDSYDAISAFDVLFHIVEDDKYVTALENIRRLLKPGGLMLFSENFTHHEHSRGGIYHYSRSLTEIRRLASSAGLEIMYRRPMFVLMNAPDDSTNRVVRAWWRMVRKVAQTGEVAGWITGMALYPFERALTTWKKESPTTEIAVGRRPY